MDDVISRKQAVEAMYALVDGCVCDDEWRENPHIDAIVDTLENLPSAHLPDMNVGDTIYRTEAIKVASGYCHPANIVDELRKLPSAQSEIIRCKDCKHWRQQTNYAGAPLSFGFCDSDYMWRSLYGETYEVLHIDTDDDFYCGYAERRL